MWRLTLPGEVCPSLLKSAVTAPRILLPTFNYFGGNPLAKIRHYESFALLLEVEDN